MKRSWFTIDFTIFPSVTIFLDKNIQREFAPLQNNDDNRSESIICRTVVTLLIFIANHSYFADKTRQL